MPGPTNCNPFSNLPPARTPGTLGINDHAHAYANGLRNSSVPSGNIRWSSFLDSLVNWRSVSGPQLAWESSAHLVITHRAVGSSILRDMLPISDVRERLLSVLSGLPQDVVWTDITLEQFSDRKHWKKITAKSGQATHFMAYRGQTQRDAYEWGMEKIFGQVEEAVKYMRESSEKRIDAKAGTSLAQAIHTLQDSFSPAHVLREKDGDRWVIAHLFVWSEQQGKDHEAGDTTWKLTGEQASEDTKLSELGNACFEATMMLLKYYVFCVVNKSSDAERQKKDLVNRYFIFRANTIFDDIPSGRPNLPPASNTSPE